MGAGHSHAPPGSSERSLRLALAISATFLLVEIAGGLLTDSLALISDAAHMFTDVAALAIALGAIRIARAAPDERRTFGYHRFEILAAMFNAQLLFVAALYIVWQAWQRLHAPPHIDSTGMLVVAILGLVANLVSMLLLHAGKDSSLNVRGAYLEVLSDALGSVGVIVGALLIRHTGLTWIDTAVAVAIGIWVLPRTWSLLKEALNILLEGVPEGIDPAQVEVAMRGVPGVSGVHSLHIWALTSGNTCLTAHVVTESDVAEQERMMPALQQLLADRFDVFRTTLQFERTACELADDPGAADRRRVAHQLGQAAGHDHRGHDHRSHDHRGHDHGVHDHGAHDHRDPAQHAAHASRHGHETAHGGARPAGRGDRHGTDGRHR